MKILFFIILFFLLTISIFSQKSSDSLKFTTGLEPVYHNIALLQAPKGKFYYKNTDILYSAFGKNFWDRLEIEIGIFPNPLFLIFDIGNVKSKFVFPISDKLKLGFGYNFTGIIIMQDFSHVFYYKQEICTGITYKNTNSLHSLNFYFGQIQAGYNIGYTDGYFAYSASYIYIKNLSQNWSVLSDNKLHIVHIDFHFPKYLGNYGDFNLFLLENVLAMRHHSNRHGLDFGIHYFLGMKHWEFKFTPLPYVAYYLCF